MSRTSRGAITYTDFEQPLNNWASTGGVWSIAPNAGYKGNALNGAYSGGTGIGYSKQYYYNYDLSNNTSLFVTVKAKYYQGSGWYGIALINSQKNRLYAIDIEATGYIEIWSYNVEARNSWQQLNYASISNYNQNNWYVIVLNYSVSNRSVDINTYVYDLSGNLVGSISASSTSNRRFTPAYIGLDVDTAVALFDDFEISTSDPRTATFLNLNPGMGVEIWDNLGNLVASGVASSTQLDVSLISDIVVGTGFGGSIIIRGAGGTPVLNYTVPNSDAILGGDKYNISYCAPSVIISQANTTASVSLSLPASINISSLTFLNITNLDTYPYYASIAVSYYSLSPNHNGAIYLISQSGASSSPITFSYGILSSSSTSTIPLVSGSGNAIIANLTSSGQGTSQLNIVLKYCSAAGDAGACVFYPISINISS